MRRTEHPPEKKEWLEGVGRRLRKARLDRELSQRKFAKMLGIHANYLYEVEKGLSTLNIYTFTKACQLLGKCANSMLGRKGRL